MDGELRYVPWQLVLASAMRPDAATRQGYTQRQEMTQSGRSHSELAGLETDTKNIMWIKVQFWSAIVATLFFLFIALSNDSYLFALLVVVYAFFMTNWCWKNWNRGKSEEPNSVTKHK